MGSSVDRQHLPTSLDKLEERVPLAVLSIFRDDEKENKQHILIDATTNGFILKMDDIKSFTLQTNYIETIQIQKFYFKNINTIVAGQYDIQTLVSLIKIKIRNVEFRLT